MEVDTASNMEVNKDAPASDTDASDSPTFNVYRRRWWILVVSCFTSLTQGLLWNNWSPIGDALAISYDWQASFLALCLCMSSVGVCVTSFPFVYIIETKGLRLGMVISVALLALGASAWNIGLPAAQSWLVAVGSLSTGVVSAITISTAPLLSVLWFPVQERTTATAAVTSVGYIGTGLAFITGPYISGANVTASQVKHREDLPPEYISDLRNGLSHLLYFDAALALCCFIMVMVYFPDRPPTPPSKSQSSSRSHFLSSLKRVVKNPQYWMLNISYNLVNGCYYSWVPLSSVNFTKSLNVDETTTGWIGFTSTMVGCVSSICIALVMDKFKRRYKLVIILLTVCASLLFAVMGCIQQRYLPLPHAYTVPILYVICILLSICNNGITPLCYELACEITYPAYEAVPSMLLTVFNNASGPFFYALFLVPALVQDMRWMTWTCLATCLLSLPLLGALRETFHRLDTETE